MLEYRIGKNIFLIIIHKIMNEFSEIEMENIEPRKNLSTRR
jgi:hypothetical protein